MSRICFAASSGGHFEQLSMLKPLMEKQESCIVTEKTDMQNVFLIGAKSFGAYGKV